MVYAQTRIVLEIHWDFGIKTDHLIPARRPHLEIVNKKNKKNAADKRILPSQPTTEKKKEI